MKTGTVMKADPKYPEKPDGNSAVEFQYKLFSDRFTGRLGMLQRQELNLKERFFAVKDVSWTGSLASNAVREILRITLPFER
jgi:hypothetical protein